MIYKDKRNPALCSIEMTVQSYKKFTHQTRKKVNIFQHIKSTLTFHNHDVV